MTLLRSIMFGAVLSGGALMAALTPAQANDYYDRYDNRYYDGHYDRYHGRHYDRGRYYGRHRGWRYGYWRGCYDHVSYDWRYGRRLRIVERVCRDPWGRWRTVDRDAYRVWW